MQCDGNTGVCPDRRIGGRNDTSLMAGQRSNGVTTVVFQRPLDSQESLDKPIPTVGRTNVIAAIGLLNSRKEANYHSARTAPQGNGPNRTHRFRPSYTDSLNAEDHRIDFTSRGVDQCPVLLAPEDKTKPTSVPPAPTTTESTVKKWKQQVVSGKKVFTARIGPTGGEKGYTAITGRFNFLIQEMLIFTFQYPGQPSWGIAWYINDLLIPEIYVERGETYTFLVEGGT